MSYRVRGLSLDRQPQTNQQKRTLKEEMMDNVANYIGLVSAWNSEPPDRVIIQSGEPVSYKDFSINNRPGISKTNYCIEQAST